MTKFSMQSAPRNGKLAAMIDEAVRHALDAWNEAAEDAARTLVGAVGAHRITRESVTRGKGPELRLYVDGRPAFRMWWRWEGTKGTLETEWRWSAERDGKPTW